MNREQVAAMIQAGLPDAQVDVQSEDDVHFSALVVSGDFEGLRLLQRHQLVYRTLGDKMGGEIHALAIRALTPGELAASD